MTGGEALQQILEVVNKLKTDIEQIKNSVHLIEANIKILNNRAAGLVNNSIPVDSGLVIPIQAEEQISHIVPSSSGAFVYKKVFGKLTNNNKEPIDGVLIRVFDKNNEVCATAETDPTGYFTFMVRVGKYMAEYTKTGFRTINKTFEVANKDKEVEIK